MLVIIPVFCVVVGSFMTRFGFFNLPTTWTMNNWARTLNDTSFTRSLINTLIIAGAAALIGPIMLSITAYISWAHRSSVPYTGRSSCSSLLQSWAG
jgi:iron(III) transport system permease protein